MSENAEEVWVTTTSSTVWVRVSNGRDGTIDRAVGGHPGAVLRLRSQDRQLAQETIYDKDADPFLNGLLKRKDADQNDDPETRSGNALADDDMHKLFKKTGDRFTEALDDLNEVNVRRLKELADTVPDLASASQATAINECIQRKYRKGGDTAAYRQMFQTT